MAVRSRLAACIVTKHEDFALLQALDRTGPAAVWIRIAGDLGCDFTYNRSAKIK
jgi:predicted nuclease of predicted toxin-antitoxin system